MKISILIPVYMKPKLVGDTLKKLAKDDHKNKEVIVVVDGETNREIEHALAHHKKHIKVIYNNERLGKVRSLNLAAKKLKSDLLVFIDNDIMLPKDIHFFRKVEKEFEHHDIGELPKEASVKGFFSGIVGFEFLSFAVASYTFSKVAMRCPSMNGAAFAIKKELFDELNGFRYVLNEDMDLASRAFFLDARFSYNPKLKVKNEVPGTLHEWVEQRKRWATSNVIWLKNNFFLLLQNFFRDSNIRNSFILVFLPMIISLIVFLILRSVHLVSLLPFIMIIGMHFNIIAGIFLGFTHLHLIVNGILPMIIGFIITGGFYFIFSLLLKFRFDIIPFVFFYIFYTPIWLIMNIVFGLAVFLNINIHMDWKIYDGPPVSEMENKE
jgi:poly-beta-1,6-N-acetyl-D-glucosamine synthase